MTGRGSHFCNYFSPEELEQFAAEGKKIFNAEYIELSLLDEYFATLAS